jgi:hypothetical protein
MKRVLLGALAFAGLGMAAVGLLDDRGAVFAERVAPPYEAAAASDLIALPGPVGEKGQLFLVIDPKLRSMAVYSIDQADGKIALCSVRRIDWDLQVTSFDCKDPLPQEIRSLLNRLEQK